MVADRTASALASWMNARDSEWRAAITTAALDPYRGYTSALRTTFPGVEPGVDSDDGSELINDQLLRFRTRNEITFTRSRPGEKNDGCHVEKKNWSVARQTVATTAAALNRTCCCSTRSTRCCGCRSTSSRATRS